MKFWTGFTIGAIASAAVVSTLDKAQQDKLRSGVRNALSSGRSGKLASTVSDSVGGIADVATERVSSVIDGATDKVASAIDAEPATTS